MSTNVIPLPSAENTTGRLFAGSRSLWKANGMKDEHLHKPIIGIVNSFSETVPGHVHLQKVGRRVKKRIEKQGLFAAEFNTMALDDGIAMGHGGMLYSLPSRDLICDTVEYMVKGHCLDAMICISNCDKITPGMLMAAMRLNIPTIFISGGPMEAGEGGTDLVDVMIAGANDEVSDEKLKVLENTACPTCGSCSGMFTANSMNCLNEALGMALPGNGTVLATHKLRLSLFDQAADRIVQMAIDHYENGFPGLLPRDIATKEAFENAMRLDIAMGGSTNTVLHILAIAHEAEVDFTMDDIDRLSRDTPVLCKVAPSSHYHVEDVNRAGGIMGILAELMKARLIHRNALNVLGETISQTVSKHDITLLKEKNPVYKLYKSAPGKVRSTVMGSQCKYYESLDLDRQSGCIRSFENAYSKDGGLAVLKGNLATNGCIVKTAGVDPSMLKKEGPAVIFDSQEDAVNAILKNQIHPGQAVIIRYEGPKGGPGMQEMLYPTSYLKARKLDLYCFLLTDGRFSGGTSGPCIGHISPEAASGGLIGRLRDGDIVGYDIPNRLIYVKLSNDEIKERMAEPPEPPKRNRTVSKTLRKYAAFVTSADTGAIHVVP